jgi:hypothetical protein
VPVLPAGVPHIKLSVSGIVAELDWAGWPADMMSTGVAIALAESSGEVTAINKSSGAAGLFQILPDAHPDMIKNADDFRWVSGRQNAVWALQIQRAAKGWTPWSAYTNKSYLPFLGPAQLAVSAWQASQRYATQAGHAAAIEHTIDADALALDKAVLLGHIFGADGLGKVIEAGAGGVADLMGQGATAVAEAAADIPGVKQANALGSIATLAVGAGKWLTDTDNILRVAGVIVGAALIIGGLNVLARPLVSNAMSAVSKLKPI